MLDTTASRCHLPAACGAAKTVLKRREEGGVLAGPKEQLTLADPSVHDVEGVPQRLVEQGTSDVVKMTYRLIIQIGGGDRDDVVATDDTRFGEAVLGTKFHF